MHSYQESIINHYVRNWRTEPSLYLWDKGPIEKLPHDFRVLEFAPGIKRKMWTYASCCMSQPYDSAPMELHVFSEDKQEGLIELLTMVAYYHRNTAKLGINHTVFFGRSWQQDSICDYGLVSLPYLDGPELENFEYTNLVKFYWLIPVTKQEVEFKKKYGTDALEERFDKQGLDYANPERKSVV